MKKAPIMQSKTLYTAKNPAFESKSIVFAERGPAVCAIIIRFLFWI
jgi:hypothetical protein